MATPISVRNYLNTTPPTNLTANIDNSLSTTNIPVASTAGYPTPPFTGCFERNTSNQEFALCTNVVDANHFTVVRGYDGTPPVGHLAPATFEHCTGAIDYREANQHHTDTTRDDHLQYALANGSRAITGLQTFNAGIQSTTLGLAGNPGSNIATRYVGGTGPTNGPPGAGTFLVGDWVIDPSGCRWTCVAAGTPGTWVAESGHMYARLFGPGAAVTLSNRTLTILTYSFTAIKGISYVVDVRFQGTIQTTDPVWVNAYLTATGGMLPAATYIMSISSAAYYPGNVVQGSCCAGLTPVATTATQILYVTATAAGAGQLRMNGYNTELILRRA
jgi:hypothetical protein